MLPDRDGSYLTVMLGEEAVRISRLQALCYLIANEAELIHLVAAVQPLPAPASSRHDLLIPLLPGAQGLRRHAKHPGYCSDAVNAVGAVRVALHCLRTLPYDDRCLDPCDPSWDTDEENLDTIYTIVAHNYA
jgi:hypothetical protein